MGSQKQKPEKTEKHLLLRNFYYYNILQRPLRHVMYLVSITPVLYITSRFLLIERNNFYRLAQW
jgi:hypothetical protein